jgi:FkbM family methyltransferase
MSERMRLVEQWYRDDSEVTRRLEYPLDRDSVVLDAGGFKGQWASDLHGRFGCRIHVFEPVSAHVEFLRHRFEGNDHITIYPYGLAARNGVASIGLEGPASSLFTGKPGRVEQIRLVSIEEALSMVSASTIDLLKLNIEGGEYDVLKALLDSGQIGRVRFIQVQFHDTVEEAKARRASIQQALSRTHTKMWDFPFVWESWAPRTGA